MQFDNFVQAAEYLAKKKYLVLRMGKFNKDKINTKNEFIIDYSNSEWKSPFMDYYLGYKCDFCISTQTGMDSFARLFRKRIGIIVNPIEDIYYFEKNWTYIFGRFRSKITQTYLKLDEIFERNLHLLKNFQEKLNIEKSINFENSNSNDILKLVSEVCEDFENKVEANKDDNIQKKFWQKYFQNVKLDVEDNYPNRFTAESKICKKFLESYI